MRVEMITDCASKRLYSIVRIEEFSMPHVNYFDVSVGEGSARRLKYAFRNCLGTVVAFDRSS